MPEFLHGRPLSPEELEMLRQQIEEGYDNIAEVDDEIHGIVARNWPHLVSNRPPERNETGRLVSRFVDASARREDLRRFLRQLSKPAAATAGALLTAGRDALAQPWSSLQARDRRTRGE